MINPTEHAEKEYLEETREKLLLAVRRIDERVKAFSSELRQTKAYIHEHQSGLDEADLVAAEQSINRMASTGESAVALRARLLKLRQSPWFGRIDITTGDHSPEPVYIGIHTFFDEQTRKNLIYDWRAPISSMFYDFELGEAFYETPSGRVDCRIHLKRQYRIRDGRMEYMIENAVNIHDEVLQKELSQAADDRMKTIVATIQRDQNAVIRNESSAVLIIQGVAGSGKTSIALHRIAFLLYRYRDTIAAKNVLIISPNRVFADYISNVLPELGEAHIPELGMDELAQDLLGNRVRFQTFFQQVTRVLEKSDEAFLERIRFKSDFEFLRKLNQYLIHCENNFFVPRALRIGRTIVPAPFIQERFKAYYRIPLLQRAAPVARDIQQFVRTQADRKLTGGEKAQIRAAVPQMLRTNDVVELYKDFFSWVDRPDMFRMAPGHAIEFSDVFPLLYCKIRVEGIPSFDHVKHLIVDEMQDYTPVQYSVISRLFKCRKTILGDVTQVVNPYSGSSVEEVQQVFPQADVIKLVRAYRSTFEIINFAQRILPNPELIAMERHGKAPELRQVDSAADETSEVLERVRAFKASGHHSMAIITRTHQQARSLHAVLRAEGVHWLTPESTSFAGGVMLTTAHLAKGLEFDEVVIPFASADNYQTEADRRMLYIACTRAMHQLTVTYVGRPSPFLQEGEQEAGAFMTP